MFFGTIRAMKKSAPKRIVVAFRLAGEPGRRKLTGFLRRIAERGLDWRMHFVRIREDFNADFVKSFAERGVDGVLFSLPAARDGAGELAKLDLPTVALDVFDDALLGRRRRNIVRISSSCDEVGRAAARHLLSLGVCRSYAFVPDLSRQTWGRLRGEAFADEMKRNGFRVARYRANGKGYDLPALGEWLARLPRPAGVFAAFDDRALQVLEACREAGLDVPRDVAVVGVDNDEMLCASATTPLTSVQPDHERIGVLAADRLADMLAGKTRGGGGRVTVGVKRVEVRESTSPATPAGRLVQRALAYIQTHFAEPIKPMDVVRELRVSRRLADLRFSAVQGESIGKAILRARLEAARHRLETTNDSIADVAAACGFARPDRMKSAFLRHFGAAPEECRRGEAAFPVN